MGGILTSTPLLEGPLPATASQSARKLVQEDRARVVAALMHHRILVPEGRTEYEWLRIFADVVETSPAEFGASPREVAPFGAVIGVVPTHNSAVSETCERLGRLRDGVIALVIVLLGAL